MLPQISASQHLLTGESDIHIFCVVGIGEDHTADFRLSLGLIALLCNSVVIGNDCLHIPVQHNRDIVMCITVGNAGERPICFRYRIVEGLACILLVIGQLEGEEAAGIVGNGLGITVSQGFMVFVGLGDRKLELTFSQVPAYQHLIAVDGDCGIVGDDMLAMLVQFCLFAVQLLNGYNTLCHFNDMVGRLNIAAGHTGLGKDIGMAGRDVGEQHMTVAFAGNCGHRRHSFLTAAVLMGQRELSAGNCRAAFILLNHDQLPSVSIGKDRDFRGIAILDRCGIAAAIILCNRNGNLDFLRIVSHSVTAGGLFRDGVGVRTGSIIRNGGEGDAAICGILHFFQNIALGILQQEGKLACGQSVLAAVQSLLCLQLCIGGRTQDVLEVDASEHDAAIFIGSNRGFLFRRSEALRADLHVRSQILTCIIRRHIHHHIVGGRIIDHAGFGTRILRDLIIVGAHIFKEQRVKDDTACNFALIVGAADIGLRQLQLSGGIFAAVFIVDIFLQFEVVCIVVDHRVLNRLHTLQHHSGGSGGNVDDLDGACFLRFHAIDVNLTELHHHVAVVGGLVGNVANGYGILTRIRLLGQDVHMAGRDILKGNDTVFVRSCSLVRNIVCTAFALLMGQDKGSTGKHHLTAVLVLGILGKAEIRIAAVLQFIGEQDCIFALFPNLVGDCCRQGIGVLLRSDNHRHGVDGFVISHVGFSLSRNNLGDGVGIGAHRIEGQLIEGDVILQQFRVGLGLEHLTVSILQNELELTCRGLPVIAGDGLGCHQIDFRGGTFGIMERDSFPVLKIQVLAGGAVADGIACYLVCVAILDNIHKNIVNRAVINNIGFRSRNFLDLEAVFTGCGEGLLREGDHTLCITLHIHGNSVQIGDSEGMAFQRDALIRSLRTGDLPCGRGNRRIDNSRKGGLPIHSDCTVRNHYLMSSVVALVAIRGLGFGQGVLMAGGDALEGDQTVRIRSDHLVVDGNLAFANRAVAVMGQGEFRTGKGLPFSIGLMEGQFAQITLYLRVWEGQCLVGRCFPIVGILIRGSILQLGIVIGKIVLFLNKVHQLIFQSYPVFQRIGVLNHIPSQIVLNRFDGIAGLVDLPVDGSAIVGCILAALGMTAIQGADHLAFPVIEAQEFCMGTHRVDHQRICHCAVNRALHRLQDLIEGSTQFACIVALIIAGSYSTAAANAGTQPVGVA